MADPEENPMVGKTILELDAHVGAVVRPATFLEIHVEGADFSTKIALNDLGLGANGLSAKEVVQLTHPEIVTDADYIAFIKGADGAAGQSAYQLALALGFVGSQAEWIASLQGDDGTNGSNGLSAYEVAVANGFVGTISAWLLSLKGTTGDAGAVGKSAYEVAVQDGFVGTVPQWLASLRGVPGTNGDDGADGKSAYQSALDTGFSGTEAAWITSLKGANGTAGQSAYQVAVAAGFVGSVAEWLDSLKGQDVDPETLASLQAATLYSARVRWMPHPVISDTIQAMRVTAGPSKLHIEPNGRDNTINPSKLDWTFDNLQHVSQTFNEGASVASYRIFNIYTSNNYTLGTNGIVYLNVKARGHQFGAWPAMVFGFQDGAANAQAMKITFTDTMSGFRTGYNGMWWPNEAIALNEIRNANNKMYKALNAGTTGALYTSAPSHLTGTAIDGNVEWEFVDDISAHSGSMKAVVTFGNLTEMPLTGFPNSSVQFATQSVVHLNRKITFVDLDGTPSYEIYTRLIDGKLVIGSPDGTRYMLFDKVGDVSLAGMSFAQRVLSLSGTEATPTMENRDILRLAQPAANTVTAITGKGYQPFRVFGSLGNTTLRYGAAIILQGGEDYLVPSGEVLQFMTNSAGNGVIEVGTTYRPKFAKPNDVNFVTKPSPFTTVVFDDPLTATRNVVLNSTNARVGEIVRVIRTENSTGGFNVSIAHGSGTRLLGIGEQTLFVYNGTNWLLAEFHRDPIPMDIAAFWPGVTIADALVTRIPVVRPFKFTANFVNSLGRAKTASSGSVTFSVQKNGVEVGFITFNASASSTFGTTGGLEPTFDIGDVLSIVAPTVADPALADIGIVLVATRL